MVCSGELGELFFAEGYEGVIVGPHTIEVALNALLIMVHVIASVHFAVLELEQRRVSHLVHFVVELAEVLLVLETAAQVDLLNVREARVHVFVLEALLGTLGEHLAVRALHHGAKSVVHVPLQVDGDVVGRLARHNVLVSLEVAQGGLSLLLQQFLVEGSTHIIYFWTELI